MSIPQQSDSYEDSTGQPKTAPFRMSSIVDQNSVYPDTFNADHIFGFGIASIFLFGPVLGTIAIYQANVALKSIDAGRATPIERGKIKTARILGCVGLCYPLLGCAILLADHYFSFLH